MAYTFTPLQFRISFHMGCYYGEPWAVNLRPDDPTFPLNEQDEDLRFTVGDFSHEEGEQPFIVGGDCYMRSPSRLLGLHIKADGTTHITVWGSLGRDAGTLVFGPNGVEARVRKGEMPLVEWQENELATVLYQLARVSPYVVRDATEVQQFFRGETQ